MMWRPLALCTTSLVYHSHGQNQAKSLIKLFNFCHNANRQPWEVRQLFSITKYRSYSACGVLNTSDGRRVRRMLSEDSCQLKQMLTPQQNVRFTQSTRDVATKRKEVQTRDPDTDPGALTTGQKVKQAGKDATYTGIVIAGLAVTGVMFFAIGRELLSGNSPSGVYSKAFKMCKKNEQVVDAIGEPMKGYGETTRRGRRRHVSHTEFDVDGVRHMRMRFYIEGPFNKGTVQCEVVKNEWGNYNFRYLFVTLDRYPHETIIIEDNR